MFFFPLFFLLILGLIFCIYEQLQPGIMAGDLYVKVNIKPHATFTRRGADLYIEKKISLLEALTGVYFEVKHLDGEILKIATPPGKYIENNKVQTIEGKGMPFFKDAFTHGNLYVKFLVTIYSLFCND